MANKMLIDATHPEETRVVVLRGNRVEEFDFESAQRKQLRGNIYLAKVTRVEPSLQAAFVDYGGNRHGFLAFSEIHPDYYQIPVADREALIAEEERAQRAADDEVDRRSRRHRQHHAAPLGEIGQIGGRGASLMLGYFDDQAATEDSFNAHGWFMTGDLGWVDANGYLRITGRKKDVIIRGGHNIYPARIEALAMRHPAVARAAAFPVADARLGEKVCLAVMTAPGADIDGAALLAHLDAAGLSKFDMPEYVLLLDEIPLTATGKILKRDLVEQVRAGRLQPLPVRWHSKGVA